MAKKRARKRSPAKRKRGGGRRSSVQAPAAALPTPDPATAVIRERAAPLTALQSRFCEEYLLDLDGAAAYRRAVGRDVSGGKQLAHTLLSLPQVEAKIRILVAARSQRTAITADVILGELLRIARVDIAQAFTIEGALKPLAEMPEDVRRAIASIEVDEIVAKVRGQAMVIGHTKKLKFWDKKGALELLGKNLKLFTDKLEVTDTTGRADRLKRARARRGAA